jgi:hypothetical protein
MVFHSVAIIIIIIIIIMISLNSQRFDLCSKRTRLVNDHAILIYYSAKNFQTLPHVLSIPAFCIRIYRWGRRLSSFRLSCNLFGDNTRCG